MTKEEILKLAEEVIQQNPIALIGTISAKKYPNIKALRKMNNEGLKTFYFSTRKESVKVKQISRKNKGSVYFYDKDRFIGIMFEGKFEIQNNTTYGISELYKLDAADPYYFCTLKFNVETMYFYYNYQTAKIEM